MAGIVDFIAGLSQGQSPYSGDAKPSFGDRMQNAASAGSQGYGNFLGDATKAKALRAVVTAYAQDEPDPDKQKQIIAQAHAGGLGDLEGMVQAHANRMGAQKQAADIQETQAHGEMFRAMAQDRTAEGAMRDDNVNADKTAGAFLQNYLTAPKQNPDDETGEQLDMEPNDKMNYAMSKTPGMSAKYFPRVLDSLTKWQAVTTDPKYSGTPQEPTNWTNPVTKRNYSVLGQNLQASMSDEELQAAATAKASAIGANQRLSSIQKSLDSMDKFGSSKANLPVNVARRQLLLEEQQELLGGGKAKPSAVGTGANPDPLGLFSK